MALAVVKRGQVVYQGARGLADLDTKTPLTPRVPVYVASVGKQFTAAAIMRLAEQGLLAYDDSLGQFDLDLPFAASVTIRQLLTHLSGVPDYLTLMRDSVPGWTNRDVLSLLRKENRLDFPPGSKSRYSNSAYVVLASVVEKVTKQTFGEYLSSAFFTPLRMTRTSVVDPTHGPPIGRARGYARRGAEWALADYESRTVGAGGIYSTIEDLVRWDRAWAERGILSDSAIRMASRPASTTSGEPTPYGVGWLAEFDAKGPLANVWYVASIGDFKGFQALYKRIPDREFTVIVLSNGGELPWNLVQLAHQLYAQR